jgi:hypothetical protein
MFTGLVARSSVIAATCFLLSGCAGATLGIAGYLWEPDPTSPECGKVIWRQVDRARIPGLCMDSAGREAREGTSCALGCVVVSQYSEAEARRRMLFGESLYDHEARHVLEGLVHPQALTAGGQSRIARL